MRVYRINGKRVQKNEFWKRVYDALEELQKQENYFSVQRRLSQTRILKIGGFVFESIRRIDV